jgi:hypothetical protein
MDTLETLAEEIVTRLKSLSDEERLTAQLEACKEEDSFVRASLFNTFGFPEIAKEDPDSIIRSIASYRLSLIEPTKPSSQTPLKGFARNLQEFFTKSGPDPEQINRLNKIIEVLNKVQKSND